ncbi:MAG TPA: hypothetical protein PLI43_15945 [Albidovulum sp.]|uniref:hypothetical protein n=1 Tax=Albidovulum sp. TaxID=1872424 RepID=UPI002BEB5308|nr:hypothetical protein [Albidovulum sp.]
MAVIPDARQLQRLHSIAGMLRDRDLAAVAESLRRVKEAEQQIDALKQNEARLYADMATAPDAQDLLQMQSYGRLVGLQISGLAAIRDARAAEVEAMLVVARRSFARANVTDVLVGMAAKERRARRERESQG